MTGFIAMLLLQYVVSVKAGLVNHVQGTANVAALESVRAGHPIKTGANGYVEILLRPGSFLRLGENSSATLDDTDLSSVKVTISQGPALIEVIDIKKDQAITVTTGKLTTRIADAGIYKFESGVATVLLGKLQTGDGKLAYEKGWQIFFQDNYRARKTGKVQETSLDVYSQTRSGAVAMANLSMVSAMAGSTNYSSWDVWLFSPRARLYTYIPHGDFRSPYGDRYYGIRGGKVPHQNIGGTTTVSNQDTGDITRPANNNNNNDNSNSSVVVAAPTPIVNTPAGQQSTPSVYIDSKNTAVGATVR